MGYNKKARPSDVAAVARVDGGARMTYRQAYDALKRESSEYNHLSATSYGLITPWLQAITELNPGTVTDVAVDSSSHIIRTFVSIAAWQESLVFCLPVVSIDAAHFKCQEGGTLFLASALSPNRDIVIIAAAVAPVEDGASWTWFLECLRRCNINDVLPPLAQPKRGRPRVIRIRNRSEYINGDSPVHCTLCLQPGHNKRTCERRARQREKRKKTRLGTTSGTAA